MNAIAFRPVKGGMNADCRCWAQQTNRSDRAVDPVMKLQLLIDRNTEG
jgi:hypothetical protein